MAHEKGGNRRLLASQEQKELRLFLRRLSSVVSVAFCSKGRGGCDSGQTLPQAGIIEVFDIASQGPHHSAADRKYQNESEPNAVESVSAVSVALGQLLRVV
jgi:hypothetical protein